MTAASCPALRPRPAARPVDPALVAARLRRRWRGTDREVAIASVEPPSMLATLEPPREPVRPPAPPIAASRPYDASGYYPVRRG